MSHFKLAHKLFITTAPRLRLPSHRAFATSLARYSLMNSAELAVLTDKNDGHYVTWENFSHHNTQYINRFAAVEKNVTALQATGALADSSKRLESKVDKGFEKIDTRFSKIEEKIDTRFNNMETKLRDDIKGIDTRISTMEDRLRDDIKGMDTRFSTMEDRLTTRLTNMEAKFTEEFKNGRTEMKELKAGQKKQEGMMSVGFPAIVFWVVALFGILEYDMHSQAGGKKT
ncbi:hypothetical protein B9Z19DRAFT_1126478 [Tuber borchii]|uniref:DUF1640-domain-containing protein n=1 Tax=Tuber borchii TaxID=42251 RepID=A0A2T6ZSZ8_TUBBO|nr:hypothetical protein B9Z19DRAFT_1126478 [Tuber borchii]